MRASAVLLLTFLVVACTNSLTVDDIVAARPEPVPWCEPHAVGDHILTSFDGRCAATSDGLVVTVAGVDCGGEGTLFRFAADTNGPERFGRSGENVIEGGSDTPGFIRALEDCDPTVSAFDTTAIPATVPPIQGPEGLYDPLEESERTSSVGRRHREYLRFISDDVGREVAPEEIGENFCKLLGELGAETRDLTLRWTSVSAEVSRDVYPSADTDERYAFLVDVVRGWCPNRLDP